MPGSNNQVSSPFEMVTSKKTKKVSTKTVVITLSIFIFLLLSIVAGVLLVRQNQNIQEKAAVSLCPGAESCPIPGQPTLIRSCNPSNADGTPQDISCSSIGVVGSIYACGTKRFCCPSLGASWTTDLSLCSTPSPTPTATVASTASPTPLGTATITPTATGSATPRVSATPRAIPVTGVDWPTVLGVGIGAAAIIGAILLAI